MTKAAGQIPGKSKLIFLALLAVLFFAYRYPYSIQKGPYSIHAWRQALGLSWTKNYMEEGYHFFKPSIHWITIDQKDGAAGECPILNYVVALLWGVFGEHYFIFRGLSLLLVYLGLFCLFKFVYRVTADRFWAIYVPVLLFTSPVLVFYSNNFLPNAPAFGLALIAFYQYWKFIWTRKEIYFYICLLLYLVAGLMKATALLTFMAILVIHLASGFSYFRGLLRIPRIGKMIHLLPMMLVFAGLIAWTLWAKEYNNKNILGMFTTGLRPIWDTKDVYDALYYGSQLYTVLIPASFSTTALGIILTLFAWTAVKSRKTDGLLFSFTGIVFLGILFFILLYFKGFSSHDYYLINLLMIIPLVLTTFLHYLKSNRVGLFYSRAFRGIAIAGLVLLVYNTMVIQRAKYDSRDTFVKHTVLIDQREKDTWRYIQREYDNNREALASITPYLRELGIERTDPVISVPDRSPVITLYLMDQKGISEYGLIDGKGNDRLEKYYNAGFKYLIVNDARYLKKPFLEGYLEKKIGEYKNVQIFELTPP